MAAFAVVLAVVFTGPLTLDNGAIRIEIDPQWFSIRFVGLPGGANFVDPLFVDTAHIADGGPPQPGGLCTDLLPHSDDGAAICRGPAEVIEQRADYIALLGPASERLNVRLKKEIQLLGEQPRARLRVSILATATHPGRFAIRNTARVPHDTTVRIAKADGEIRPITGTDEIAPAVVNSIKHWLIPVPPTARMKGVVLGAFVPEISLKNTSGVWTRRLLTMPQQAVAVPQGCTCLCLLDDPTRSYGAALQGALEEVTLDASLVFEEEWAIEARGAKVPHKE